MGGGNAQKSKMAHEKNIEKNKASKAAEILKIFRAHGGYLLRHYHESRIDWRLESIEKFLQSRWLPNHMSYHWHTISFPFKNLNRHLFCKSSSTTIVVQCFPGLCIYTALRDTTLLSSFVRIALLMFFDSLDN